MKYFFALAAMAGLVSSHSLITHFHVNGKADSSCVRQVADADPVVNLSSNDMACGIVGKQASTKCKVQGGDSVAFEWRVDRNIPAAEYPLKGDEPVGVIDDSHMGPCAVYAKKVDNALTAVGAGDGWFKISEDGLDSNGVFCSTRLRKSNAPQPAKIPTTIEPGDYLLRAEILTLNNAGAFSIGGQEEPQFYQSCIAVTVEGTTGTANPDTVSIPGFVEKTSPGLIFDVWNSPTFKNYPIPGPKVFRDEAGVVKPSAAAPSSETPLATTSSCETPVEDPTQVPVEDPTEAPVEDPTEAPVEDPTEAPVEDPTKAPVEVPAPTKAPIVSPTTTNTPAHTTPTRAPIAAPIYTVTVTETVTNYLCSARPAAATSRRKRPHKHNYD